MVEQLTTEEQIHCIYKKNRICHLKQGIPLDSYCHSCKSKIEDIKNCTIKYKFGKEKYQFHQLPIPLNKREYATEDDLFSNPIFTCLKTVRFQEPSKKDKIKFNIFNLTQFEYYFEVFELELKDLPEFIWHLEEFGYSEQLLEKFQEHIIEHEV